MAIPNKHGETIEGAFSIEALTDDALYSHQYWYIFYHYVIISSR